MPRTTVPCCFETGKDDVSVLVVFYLFQLCEKLVFRGGIFSFTFTFGVFAQRLASAYLIVAWSLRHIFSHTSKTNFGPRTLDCEPATAKTLDCGNWRIVFDILKEYADLQRNHAAPGRNAPERGL
jgi:hypothetical protein